MSAEILLTPTEALVTQAFFDRMQEYSSSMPTAPSVGRYWKRQKNWRDPNSGWLMGSVEQHPDPELVTIRWRELIVLETTQ